MAVELGSGRNCIYHKENLHTTWSAAFWVKNKEHLDDFI